MADHLSKEAQGPLSFVDPTLRSISRHRRKQASADEKFRVEVLELLRDSLVELPHEDLIHVRIGAFLTTYMDTRSLCSYCDDERS